MAGRPIVGSGSAIISPFQAAIAQAGNASVQSLSMENVKQAYGYAYEVMSQATERATTAAGFDLEALGLSVDHILTIGLLVVVMSVVYMWMVSSATSQKKKSNLIAAFDEVKKIAPNLTPLEGFDVEKEEPVKVRPFKTKYNLTMALETLDPNELILMDKTYRERIRLRKTTLKENRNTVRAVNRTKGADGASEDPRIRPAIEELYSWIMAHYLPTRYPTMFRLVETTFETGDVILLHNRITGEVLPATMSKTENIEDALERMNITVDEDMLILLPQETVPENQPENDVVANDRIDGAPTNA
ncbi:hypothetical protein KEM54_001942, partial [Ascosphaera aggregata]